MQPLSVQAASPEVQPGESRKLIPHSQGLLATAEGNHSVPELPKPHDGRQSDAAPQVMGLKLLRLHPPPSSPHHPPSQRPPSRTQSNHQQRLNVPDHSASKRAEEENRDGAAAFKRQLGFNHPHNPTQNTLQTSEAPRGHTQAPMLGLRLLHVDSSPQSNVSFPRIQLPKAPVSTAVYTATTIKLLRLDPEPQMARNTSKLKP